MSKIAKNKLYFWLTVAIVFIVITYYYQKSKAAEEYQEMLEVAAKNCDLGTLKLLIKKKVEVIQALVKEHYMMLQRKDA